MNVSPDLLSQKIKFSNNMIVSETFPKNLKREKSENGGSNLFMICKSQKERLIILPGAKISRVSSSLTCFMYRFMLQTVPVKN